MPLTTGMHGMVKPKIKTVKIYPTLRILPIKNFRHTDYIEMEFREKGIYIVTNTDNCGNEFIIPYEIVKGMMLR